MTVAMADRVAMPPQAAAALDLLTRPHEVSEAGWAVRSLFHHRRVDDDESQQWVGGAADPRGSRAGQRRGPTSRHSRRCAGCGRPSASRCA